MSTQSPEQKKSDFLLRRTWRFDSFEVDDLDVLQDEIRAAFDRIIHEHAVRNGFAYADYEVIFYRGDFLDGDIFGYDLTGSFRLGSTNKHILGKFYEGCYELFTEVREEIRQRPGGLTLEVSVIGFNENNHTEEA